MTSSVSRLGFDPTNRRRWGSPVDRLNAAKDSINMGTRRRPVVLPTKRKKGAGAPRNRSLTESASGSSATWWKKSAAAQGCDPDLRRSDVPAPCDVLPGRFGGRHDDRRSAT